jgi:hypothetical protein
MNATEKIEHEWAPASTVLKVVLLTIVILIIAGMVRWPLTPPEEQLARTVLGHTQMMHDELAEVHGESATSVRDLVIRSARHESLHPYLKEIPERYLADRTIRDPWGNEVIFVPANTERPGMPRRVSPYFMSSGPDGEAATLMDNVYSYTSLR